MAKLIKSPRSLLSEIRIVAATVYQSYEWLLHKFNTLSLELWGIGEDISTLVYEVTCYTSSHCKHLTLPHLPQNLDWLEKCVNLQSLRILHPLTNYEESKLKDKLASLDKKISVKYTVVPEAKANQIFTLNEDCIQMVLSSLTDTNATIAFGLTAPRFKEIISRTSLPLITIGKETLEKYPLDKDLSAYEMIGRCSTKLKVANINSGHLKEILPLFPCLRELDLSYLGIGRVADHDKNLVDLLRNIQKTLKSFACNNVRMHLKRFGFLDLQKLTTLALSLDKDSGTFWTRNKNLQKLTLLFENDGADSRYRTENWKKIAKLPNLKSLTVSLNSFGENQFPNPMPNFESLEELRIFCGESILDNAITLMGIAGKALRTFYLEAKNLDHGNPGWVLFDRLEQLKHVQNIELNIYDKYCPASFKQRFQAFKKERNLNGVIEDPNV